MSMYRDMCVLLGPSYGESHHTSSTRLFANAGRVQTSFRESSKQLLHLKTMDFQKLLWELMKFSREINGF